MFTKEQEVISSGVQYSTIAFAFSTVIMIMYWWLRTPNASNARIARYVSTGGSLDGDRAYRGSNGVRPALYLESGSLVSDSTDT